MNDEKVNECTRFRFSFSYTLSAKDITIRPTPSHLITENFCSSRIFLHYDFYGGLSEVNGSTYHYQHLNILHYFLSTGLTLPDTDADGDNGGKEG